mgnify:FL=1
MTGARSVPGAAVDAPGGSTPPASTTMRSAIRVAAVAFCLTGCASGFNLDRIVAQGREKARADAQRAVEIAEHGLPDPAAVACARAILAAVNQRIDAPSPPTPNGALSGAIAVRKLRRAVQAPSDETVKIACAPLVLDAEVQIIKIGRRFVQGL